MPKNYQDILDKHRIEPKHWVPLLDLVLRNKGEAGSDFIDTLNSNRRYQRAVEDAQYRRFSEIRELFQLAYGEDSAQ